MAETTLPYFTSWQFMDSFQETGFIGDEELHRNQFGVDDFDFSSSMVIGADDCMEYDSRGQIPAKTFSSQPTANGPSFPDASTFIESFSCFDSPENGVQQQFSLGDLFQSASPLAAERALYMHIPANPPIPESSSSQKSIISSLPLYQSPIPDSCSSPGTSHISYNESEEDWDRERGSLPFYQLPDSSNGIFPRQEPVSTQSFLRAPHKRPAVVLNNNPAVNDDSSLTPLEMPDGSTRFTTNWLPVDPTGGFTIGAHILEDGYRDDRDLFDPIPMNYNKEAFISVNRQWADV